jgi:hypothetical protein
MDYRKNVKRTQTKDNLQKRTERHKENNERKKKIWRKRKTRR